MAASKDDKIDTFDINPNNGVLAAFKIDHNSGDLEWMDTYNVGKWPMWVLIMELG